MHLIYVDDSRDEGLCVFSALAIPGDLWQDAFGRIREFRRRVRDQHGIYVHCEFHAWKFVSGRGSISPHIVTKWDRCQIYKQALDMVAHLPGVRLFNAVFNVKQDELAFERLLNRINRAMQVWDSHAILVCDEGKESGYTRLARKMHVYNPIPSRFGVWNETGTKSRNIPIERIIEDPFFQEVGAVVFDPVGRLLRLLASATRTPVAVKEQIRPESGIQTALAHPGSGGESA